MYKRQPLTASMVIIKKNNIEFLMQFAFLITAGVVYVYAKNIGLDVLSFLQFINGAYSALYLIYWVVLYNLSGKHGG